MAPKKGKPEVEKADQCLQAVVVAEAYDGAFRPLGLPKALVEVCGRPVLEYTLRFLASAGVGEVFVLSSAHHAGAVEAFVASRAGASDWIRRRDGTAVDVRVLPMAGCASVGDMLRELDQRGVVKSDPFLMCGGDVVAHVEDVDAIIAEHVARKKKKDPDATMTMLMAKAGDRLRRCIPLGGDDDLVLALDEQTSRVVAWHLAKQKQASKRLPFSIDDDCKAESVKIHSDLADCHVDVCSQEVLFRYSENFDYQHVRRDFVHHEVSNVELGQRVYVKVLGPGEGFGAKVSDPRALDFVSRDLINGWYQPTCAPAGALVADGSYSALDGKPPRSCEISAPACVGARVVLGEGCVVRESTLGAGCVVGDGADVRGSHLGAGCVVEAGATVVKALLAPGVVVKAGATVAKGCLLGEGVVVGATVALPAFSKVTAKRPRDKAVPADDAALVGPDGAGRLYRAGESPESDDDDDDGDDFGAAASGRDVDDSDDDDDSRTATTNGEDESTFNLIGNEAAAVAREAKWRNWEDYDSDKEASDSDTAEPTPYDDGDGDDLGALDDLGDFGGGGGAAATFAAAPVGSASDAAFQDTVREMIVTGYKNGSAVDSMVMEINCYKLSENRSFRDAALPALDAVLAIAFANKASKQAVCADLKSQLAKWQPLLAKVLGFGDVQEELHALERLEDLVPTDPGHARALLADPDVYAVVLQLLYGADIVSGEGILAWGEQTDQDAKLRKAPQIVQLLAFLDESDDDESDEESD